ncbi:MAG: SUF system NifU family Fe-S cluster assembly protein [bacterium]|nr:SUF system NifU family Fe-S cluster assembly protein [bacterium]
MIEDLIREEILEHFRNPSNYGKLEGAKILEGVNPLCGDEFRIYITENSDKIEDIKFEGHGCSISTASASIMTEIIKGLSKKEAYQKAESFKNFITSKDSTNDANFEIFAGVRKYPVRIKCALLPWQTIIGYLNG